MSVAEIGFSRYLMIKQNIVICLLLLFSIGFNAQNIVINEVMPQNHSTFVDEFGDKPDWFELYNRGNQVVNLAGYGVSDDADNPYKWVFPDIDIVPGGHLLVMASERDITVLNYWDTIIDWGDEWQHTI
ncbi:MAG: lamin tail domain-containing protein, partial [Candidatus Cloacimonetes bacterium]|nr:lamin tail domain-containing protein [Candidatus Cloacimonadota bacterium]